MGNKLISCLDPYHLNWGISKVGFTGFHAFFLRPDHPRESTLSSIGPHHLQHCSRLKAGRGSKAAKRLEDFLQTEWGLRLCQSQGARVHHLSVMRWCSNQLSYTGQGPILQSNRIVWGFQFLHNIAKTYFLFFFFNITILVNMKWYLIVALTFIFLMNTGVEHFFTCLLAICISSVEKKIYAKILPI